MKSLNLAIDLSNYSGKITLKQAYDLYAAGVRRAIVQVVNPNILTHRDQYPNLKTVGIEIQAYVYVWFGPDSEQFMRERVEWATHEIRTYMPSVAKVWLDCEQSDSDTPPFDYVHAPVSPTIRASVDTVKAAGLVPGIYTAAWWWIPGASNSPEWSDLDLWDANYDLDPDLDPVNYGGWSVPRMTQYQGSTVLAGVPMIDLDAYEVEAPPVDVDGALAKLREAIALLGG